MGENTYRLVPDWPRYPEAMNFEMGSGVTVDDDGVIYLFTRDLEHWAAHPLAMSAKMGKSSISMFDREGSFLGKWGPSDEPGFALGAHTIYFIDGHIWTVDRDGHVIKKYAKDGTLLLTRARSANGATALTSSTARPASRYKRTAISSSPTATGTPG